MNQTRPAFDLEARRTYRRHRDDGWAPGDARALTLADLDARTTTCGTCGRVWTWATPAARCPWELDHAERAEPAPTLATVSGSDLWADLVAAAVELENWHLVDQLDALAVAAGYRWHCERDGERCWTNDAGDDACHACGTARPA